MKQKFINAVEGGDVVSVRFFISNEMLLDPRGLSCQEMVQFAEERLPDLYEKEDENIYSYTDADLNNDYLCKIKNDLDFCFTKNLLMFYIEVAKIVLKDKADEISRHEETQSRQGNRSEFTSASSDSQCETEANPIMDTVEHLYHSKGFWPTVGLIGAAFVYLLTRITENQK